MVDAFDRVQQNRPRGRQFPFRPRDIGDVVDRTDGFIRFVRRRVDGFRDDADGAVRTEHAVFQQLPPPGRAQAIRQRDLGAVAGMHETSDIIRLGDRQGFWRRAKNRGGGARVFDCAAGADPMPHAGHFLRARQAPFAGGQRGGAIRHRLFQAGVCGEQRVPGILQVADIEEHGQVAAIR